MGLTTSAALALALACEPRVAPDVQLSLAYTESHWRTLAIHDNVTGEAFEARSKNGAEQIAARLIAGGHNPDHGLPQINAANLSRTRLTVTAAFDPCAPMHAGAQVLLQNYSGGATSAEQRGIEVPPAGTPYCGQVFGFQDYPEKTLTGELSALVSAPYPPAAFLKAVAGDRAPRAASENDCK